MQQKLYRPGAIAPINEKLVPYSLEQQLALTEAGKLPMGTITPHYGYFISARTAERYLSRGNDAVSLRVVNSERGNWQHAFFQSEKSRDIWKVDIGALARHLMEEKDIATLLESFANDDFSDVQRSLSKLHVSTVYHENSSDYGSVVSAIEEGLERNKANTQEEIDNITEKNRDRVVGLGPVRLIGHTRNLIYGGVIGNVQYDHSKDIITSIWTAESENSLAILAYAVGGLALFDARKRNVNDVIFFTACPALLTGSDPPLRA